MQPAAEYGNSVLEVCFMKLFRQLESQTTANYWGIESSGLHGPAWNAMRMFILLAPHTQTLFLAWRLDHQQQTENYKGSTTKNDQNVPGKGNKKK